MDIPVIGLGTFRLKGEEAFNSVKMGLEIGYRHIDTAQIYENEAEVGKAVADSKIPREEIFITTKIWTSNFNAEKLIPSLHESLKKLQTTYVDLLLLHWPNPAVTLEETLGELMKAKEQGLALEIGISNFPIAEMKKAIAIIGSENIFTNQFEVHPYLQNKKLIDFCHEHDILVTAYMPLAVGKVVNDETLMAIGKKYGVSAADVALSWIFHQDLLMIPSSTKRQNLETNFNFPELAFTKDELKKIEALDDGSRIATPPFAPKWDI